MAYLDHAATTPMLPEAVQVMTAVLGECGNPSSLHASGRRARRIVEEARERIAAALGAGPNDVIFTSGGTESDNLAVKGIFWARHAADPARRAILASPVEHHAVLDAVEWLGRHEGAEVIWLDVDEVGRVRPEALAEALAVHGDAAALITVMWANNEVGTVQPIAELAALAREHGVPFHTDAVQAVGAVPVDFAASGVSALTVSAHKVGGPLGVGALLLDRNVPCAPLLHGGGQERDIRSGTLDAPAIAAFAAAVEVVVKNQADQAARLVALRDDLVARVQAVVPEAILNGDPGPGRLPGNVHFSFPGCEGDALLMVLDAQGIECSTGAACTTGVAQPSHVVLALGAGVERARGALRFTLGHTSTVDDVDALVEAIGPAVERARRANQSRGASVQTAR